MGVRADWDYLGPEGQRGRCLTLGRGRDIVLVSSPLARGECYLPTARALAGLGRTHLIEMPGSGGSDRVSSPWSLDDYAAWLARAIAERGLEGPAVIGHSYSGAIAVALAARHPRLCSALLVADAPGAGAPTSLVQALRGAVVDVALDFGVFLAMWHHVASNVCAHPRNALHGARESLRLDVRALARQVAVPSLVAWGARDHTIPRWAAEVFAASLSGAQFYLSPRGTHAWPVSQPEEFAGAVRSFLGSLAAPSAPNLLADSPVRCSAESAEPRGRIECVVARQARPGYRFSKE